MSSNKSIPLVVELIPYVFQVLVYTHDIHHSKPEDHNAPQTFLYTNYVRLGKPLNQFNPFRSINNNKPTRLLPCWTFVSEGLAAHGQKEISFTLCRKKEEEETDFPEEIIILYLTIYDLACKGLTVDIGGYTAIAGELFPGVKNMRTIIYSKNRHPEIKMDPNVIHAILITDEERLVFDNYGMTRLLGHMGNAERRFPFPQWNDRFRKSVVTMTDMESSILNSVAKTKISGVSVTLVRQSINKICIMLQIPSNKHAIVCDIISKLGPQDSLTILTELDDDASSCLIWKAGQEGQVGISIENVITNRVGGCFIILCPHLAANEVLGIEDGFSLLLTDNTYQHLRQALLSRNSLCIKFNDGQSFVLEWNKIEESNKPKSDKNIEIVGIIFLVQLKKMEERIGVKALADYISKLIEVISNHFTSMEENDGFGLKVDFSLKECGAVDITFYKIPPNYDDTKILLHNLQHDLSLVESPQVYIGPFAFRIEVNVWGGYSSTFTDSTKVTFSHSHKLIGESPEGLKREHNEMVDYVNSQGLFINNFSNWTSGNDKIDELLRDSQCTFQSFITIMEWIPYENLVNIEYLAEGGFATVYSAGWHPAYINKYDVREHRFERVYEDYNSSTSNTDDFRYGYYDSETSKFIEDNIPKVEGHPVVLKSFNKTKDSLTHLLYELKQYCKVAGNSYITRCFGVTKNPKTGEYLLVVNYCGMDLHVFFNNAKNSSVIVTWHERLNILYELVMGITTIHSHDLVHQDLHPGNILYQRYATKDDMSFGQLHFNNRGKSAITDFGLCRTVNKLTNTTKIYGVLPYVAPEVLKGKPFTKASDIYSLGSLMYKLGTGYSPFHNMPYDGHLCLEITKGKRPPPIDGAPKFYEKLMRRCWDENPENRLTIEEIEEIVKTWVDSPNQPSEEIRKEIEMAENVLKTHPPTRISDFNLENLETNIINQLQSIDSQTSKLLPTNDISLVIPDVEYDDTNDLDQLTTEIRKFSM